RSNLSATHHQLTTSTLFQPRLRWSSAHTYHYRHSRRRRAQPTTSNGSYQNRQIFRHPPYLQRAQEPPGHHLAACKDVYNAVCFHLGPTYTLTRPIHSLS